ESADDGKLFFLEMLDKFCKTLAEELSGSQAEIELPQGLYLQHPPQYIPSPKQPEADPHKLTEARHLFQIGERCRREGDLDLPVNCNKEAELLCPKRPSARLAAERLRQIKQARAAKTGAGEEQEPPANPPSSAMPPARSEADPVKHEEARAS